MISSLGKVLRILNKRKGELYIDTKVYIVVGETLTYDDAYTSVAGVHLNEESGCELLSKFLPLTD